MKKMLLSVAIASVFGLVGCGGGDTIAELKQQVQASGSAGSLASQPFSRVVFDPANSILSVPNDLLFSGTNDGTLVMPGEKDDDDNLILNPDYMDPKTAIGALDGWSTSVPFVLEIDLADGVTLDATSVGQSDAVIIFEAGIGGPLSAVPECVDDQSVSLCQIQQKLTFGVDYVTSVNGNNIVVIPLKPLKASQGYFFVMTNSIMDSNGNPLHSSTSYESLRRDFATLPLPLASQQGLQFLINSYENGAVEQGIDKDSIIYTVAFTTQSTDDVLQTIKSVMAGVPGEAPTLTALDDQDSGAGDELVSGGLIAPDSSSEAIANMASVYKATLQNTPYYLETITTENCQLMTPPFEPTFDNCPSLFSRFRAKGDSPITVLGAVQAGVLTDFTEQYDTQAPFFGRGDFESPADLVGMTFTIGGFPIDAQRHTTRFNPWPANTKNDLEVLATLPNIDQVNAVRMAEAAKFGIPWNEATMGLSQPESGWPVMIYAHGITTNKETLFTFAGAMANAGIAVVAIDHPLHGTRGGTAKIPGSETSISASTGQVTAYLNLASLLTARDNVRQSEADLLALRLAINGLAGTGIDVTKVSFFGHSLGGITGTTFVSVANSGSGSLKAAYEVKAASMLAPGGSIPGVLLNSVSFAPVVKDGLTASSPFQQALADAAADNGIPDLAAFKEADPEGYDDLVDAVYGPFSAQFNFAAQTILESGDPVNYAMQMGQNTPAIHIMEVVGEEGLSPSDQVIPNNAAFPLVGTDPLIRLMGLAKVTTTPENLTELVKGFVPFKRGHHNSILRPNAESDVAPTAEEVAVMTEMQTQLASFMKTQGAELTITASDVIAD